MHSESIVGHSKVQREVIQIARLVRRVAPGSRFEIDGGKRISRHLTWAGFFKTKSVLDY
jgi:hypothetical protein